MADENEHILVLSHGELFEIFQTGNEKNICNKYVELQFKISEMTGFKNLPKESKVNLSRFFSSFKTRWESAQRIRSRFVKNNTSWLNVKLSFTKKPSNKGRKQTEFEQCSERTKRFKTTHLRNSASSQELAYAAQMRYRKEGETSASKLIKILSEDPAKAKLYCDALKEKESSYRKLSPDEALSLMVETNLTKGQYKFMRLQAEEKNCFLYPAYYEVLNAKRRCYPDNISVSETEAEIRLQFLLNHTCQRILHLQQEVLERIEHSTENLKLILICKWGFDGSSGHSEYKQRFQSPENSDSSVFFTSLVPIRLTYREERRPDIIVWQNSRPSSTRYCRPIKLQFAHETTELILREKGNLDNQISNLAPLKSICGRKNVEVYYELYFTMIDGKVGNALSETKSAQRCFLCGATSKEFNNITEILKRPLLNEAYLKFGLSPLHAWIRFFECLLHLAYKLETQKWQARSVEDKLKVAKSKKRIQEQLHSKLGLIVDKPKPGFGTSNDGNTARKFFENAEIVTQILKIDIRIVKNFHIILQTLSSGYHIDTDKFNSFALGTAKLFSSLYPWYPMPTSIHKILIHGSEIIASFILPIGLLSEEAQEARNKDIKKFRLNFSRKTSRQDNLTDTFNRLLVSSDPLISNFRKLPPKKSKHLSLEAINLIKAPEVRYSEDHKLIVRQDSSSSGSDDE